MSEAEYLIEQMISNEAESDFYYHSRYLATTYQTRFGIVFIFDGIVVDFIPTPRINKNKFGFAPMRASRNGVFK